MLSSPIAPVAWLVAAAMLVAHTAAAGAAESRIPSTIEVTAEAEVEAQPDRAMVELGVVSQGETAAAATQRNAEQMQAVLGALRKSLGSDARIDTGTFSVNPDYARERDGATPPQVVGYTVRNLVRVTVEELTRVGSIVDTAVKAGGNQVQRITFTLRDPAAAQNEALTRAVQAAREKAQVVAAGLGLQVTGFYSAVVHEIGTVRPVFQEMSAVARLQAAAPTPIQPGRIPVRSRVTLTMRVGG